MARIAIAITLALLALVFLASARLVQIIDPRRPKAPRHGRRKTHLLVVLGSGGHTAEMIAMLESAVSEPDAERRLGWNGFTQRTWVVSSGDSISAERAKKFEESATKAGTSEAGAGTYDIKTVPRAREIHQPLYTAPISSFRCLIACIQVLTRHGFPDLILCNGPATATILVFTSILLRFFNLQGCNSRGRMRTVYIESWARVKKLSLSGNLLKHVVDRFLVQWPQLEQVGGRAEYMGVLV